MQGDLPGGLALEGAKEKPQLVAFTGKVGAAEHSHDDLSFVKQGQRDGILSAGQEPLGAVDGIKGPEALLRVGGASQIEPAQNIVGGGVRVNLLHPLGDGFKEGSVVGVFEIGAVFFADDSVVGEVLLKRGDDEGLGDKVGDGDRALITLDQGLGVAKLVLNLTTEF